MKDKPIHQPDAPTEIDVQTAIAEYEASGNSWADLPTRKKNTLIKGALSTRLYLELCDAIMGFRQNKEDSNAPIHTAPSA